LGKGWQGPCTLVQQFFPEKQLHMLEIMGIEDEGIGKFLLSLNDLIAFLSFS